MCIFDVVHHCFYLSKTLSAVSYSFLFSGVLCCILSMRTASDQARLGRREGGEGRETQSVRWACRERRESMSWRVVRTVHYRSGKGDCALSRFYVSCLSFFAFLQYFPLTIFI